MRLLLFDPKTPLCNVRLTVQQSGCVNATTFAKSETVRVTKRGEFDKPVKEVVSGALSAIDSLPARFENALH